MIELWDFGEPWNQIRDAVLWVGSGGSGWPQGNEDQIRQLADEWREFSAKLTTGIADAQAAAVDLEAAWGGGSGAAFAEIWQNAGVKSPQELLDLIAAEGGIIASIAQAALQIEYNKLSAMVEVSVLILEIFVYAVMVWFTFLAALAAAGVRIAASRAFVAQLVRFLVTQAAESFGQQGIHITVRTALGQFLKHLPREALNELFAEVGTDSTAQAIQKAWRTRAEWDKKMAIASGIGGVFGAGLSFLTPIGRKIADGLDGFLARRAARLVTDAADEVLTEVGAETMANGAVYHQWGINLDDLANRVGSGMVRDKVSEGARLTERAEDLARGWLGLPTSEQRAHLAATAAAEAARREAQASAAAAHASAARAAESAAAASSAAAAAQQHATRVSAEAGTSAAARQATAAAESAEQARVMAQRSADNAARAAQSATQAAQTASQASAAATEAGTPQDAARSAQAASVARVEAGRQAAIAAMHADLAAGQPNAGVPNAGVPNAGLPNAGVPNAGQPNAGVPNAGLPNAGVPNAGQPNAGVPNAGLPNAGVPNAGVPNAGVPNAGQPNAGVPNAGQPNAGVPNAGVPNAGQPNAGQPIGNQADPRQSNSDRPRPAADGTPQGPSPPSDAGSPGSGSASGRPGRRGFFRRGPGGRGGGRATGRRQAGHGRRRDVAGHQPSRGQALLGGGRPAPLLDHHDPSSPFYQRRLDQEVPRDRLLRPLMHPDPTRGIWVSLLNDGGPWQPGRGNNCVAAVHALLSTWFGKPLVAGSNRNGPSTSGATEEWLGGRFEGQRNGTAGLSDVQARLLAAGHGSAAAVAVRLPGSPVAHMIGAVNHGGQVYWLDPQNLTEPLTSAPYVGDDITSDALLLDANGVVMAQEDARPAALAGVGFEGTPRPTLQGRAALMASLAQLGNLTNRVVDGRPTDAQATAMAELMERIDQQLRDMGLGHAGSERRWQRLDRMVAPATLLEVDLLNLVRYPGWQQAYAQAVRTPAAARELVTGRMPHPAAAVARLTRELQNDPAPRAASVVENVASARVFTLMDRDFDGLASTIDGNTELWFAGGPSRQVRVESALLPPDVDVTVLWDERHSVFRIAVRHDLNPSQPVQAARLDLALTRALRTVSRTPPGSQPLDRRPESEALVDLFQQYYHSGVHDLVHVIDTILPPDRTDRAAQQSAAIEHARFGQDTARAVDELLAATLAAFPRPANRPLNPPRSGARGRRGGRPRRSPGGLAGPPVDADVVTVYAALTRFHASEDNLSAMLARIADAGRSPAEATRLTAAAMRLAAAEIRDTVAAAVDNDVDVSGPLSIVDYVVGTVLADPAAFGRLVRNDGTFTPAALARLRGDRTATLSVLRGLPGEPDGHVTLAAARHRDSRLDASMQLEIRENAGDLRFDDPPAEAAASARWGPTLRALAGQGTAGADDAVSQQRQVIRRTVADPDRVTARYLPNGSTEFEFQRRWTDQNGAVRVVAVTVAVERVVNRFAAHIAGLAVTEGAALRTGRPAGGPLPDRVAVAPASTMDEEAVNRAAWPWRGMAVRVEAASASAAGPLATRVGTDGAVYELPSPSGGPALTVSVSTSRPTWWREAGDERAGRSRAVLVPPMEPGGVWQVVVNVRALTHPASLELAIAEAFAAATAIHETRLAGLPYGSVSPSLSGRPLSPASAGSVGRLVQAARLAAARSGSDRFRLEAYGLIDELGLRVDDPLYEQRRDEVRQATQLLYGSAEVAALGDLLNTYGRADALPAAAAEQRVELDRRRARTQQQAAVNAILLDELDPNPTVTINALGGVTGTGPALHGPALVAALRAALPDIVEFYGSQLIDVNVAGTTLNVTLVTPPGARPADRRRFRLRRQAQTTVQTQTQTQTPARTPAPRPGQTQAEAEAEATRRGPQRVSLRITVAPLPAGTQVRLDPVGQGDVEVSLTVADGLNAESAALALVGAVAHAAETRRRLNDDGRANRPADVLGDHDLPRRRRPEFDDMSQRDVMLSSQIQWQAERAMANPTLAAFLDLATLLHAAGARDGQSHAPLRRRRVEAQLTPEVMALVRALYRDLPAGVETSLRHQLAAAPLGPPVASQGRARLLPLPVFGVDSTGSLTAPTGQPLRPWIARQLGTVISDRGVRRFERRVIAARHRIDRFAARRNVIIRAVVWPGKFVFRTPLGLITAPMRFQRPWRVFAASTSLRVGWVTAPDGRRVAVAFLASKAKRAINRLGGRRMSQYTTPTSGMKIDFEVAPTGRPLLDAVLWVVQHGIKGVTLDGHGVGFGTPLPFSNSDVRAGRTVVRGIALGRFGGVRQLRTYKARSSASNELVRRHGATATGFMGMFVDFRVFGIPGFYVMVGGQFGTLQRSGDLDELEEKLRKLAEEYRRDRGRVGHVAALRTFTTNLAAVAARMPGGTDIEGEIQVFVIEIGFSHRRNPFTGERNWAGGQANPNATAYIGDVHPVRAVARVSMWTLEQFRMMQRDRERALGLDRAPGDQRALPPAAKRPRIAAGPPNAQAEQDLVEALRPPGPTSPEATRYDQLRRAQAASDLDQAEAAELAAIEAAAQVDAGLRRELDFADWVRARGMPPVAATVIPDTSVAEHMAAGVPVRPLSERYSRLETLLRQRWERGDTSGELPRGDSFVRGIEVVGSAPGGGIEVRVDLGRNRSLTAYIRFGDTGTDQEGNRRRATTDIPTGGPDLELTLASDHPVTADVFVTIAHEMAEARAHLRHATRRRILRASSAVPPASQPDQLSAARLPWHRGQRLRLSPHDIGGIADLETSVLRLVTTVDPAERDRLVDDIEALRRHLGLDPEVGSEEDRRDTARRWRLVDEQLRTGDLPNAAVQHLRALRGPNWRANVPVLATAAWLADHAGRRVSVNRDGELEVSARRRNTIRVRVIGRILPAGTLEQTTRRPDGSLELVVPLARLGQPAAVAAAVTSAVTREERRWRLRRSSRLLSSLTDGVDVPDTARRMAPAARGSWAAAEAVARSAVELTGRHSRAGDPATRRQLRRLLEAELRRLDAMLRSMGVLEGQDGFLDRRAVIARTAGAPADLRVAELLNPWTRESDPDLTVALLAAVAPLAASYAHVRGAVVTDGPPTMRVMLDDVNQTTFDLPISATSRGPVVALGGDPTTGWHLLVRSDATRAVLAVELSGVLVELAARVAGGTNGTELLVESTASRLAHLAGIHPLVGPLARQAVRARVIELVEGLAATPRGDRSDRHQAVLRGGRQLVGRMSPQRVDRALEHFDAVGADATESLRRRAADAAVAPIRTGRGAPLAWMYYPGRVSGSIVSGVFNLVSGRHAGRDAVVLMAQIYSTIVYAIAQSYWDGKRRESEDRTAELTDQARREANQPAAAPANWAPTAPDPGSSSGAGKAPTAPPPAFGPNLKKRMYPSTLGGLASLLYLLYGDKGFGSVAGMLPSTVQGSTYGSTDAIADHYQTQANLDRQHELSQRPDGQLYTILDGIYRLVAEEHDRLSAQSRDGVLNAVLDEPTRIALISSWQQTRDLIRDARAPLAAREPDLRQEIRGRRRLHRLIWRGSAGGVADLTGAGGAVRATIAPGRWVVRTVRRRPGTATPTAPSTATASTPGMPPARHYRLRVFVPYGAGGMSSIMMMSVLDPSHLAMAAVTGVATTVAGLGLGQGWADHRRDEVADAIPLAELTALHHANQALDQVERVLAALGDPTARPPAPRTRRSGMLRRRVPDVPSTVHGPSIAIEKHLLAMIFRAAAVQAIGDLLIDDEQLIALLTGGQIAVETLAGVGEAVFRILAGRVRQDHQERMAQAEARGLPVNHEEMAEQVRAFVEIAAELARMVAANRTNPPSGGAAGGPTGP